MRLEQLKYLAAIIECRSFNKASKILHITQPALTSAIKALEEELGVSLLSRDTKGVIPTSTGERVYADICVFMKNFDAMVESWKPAKKPGPIRGEARILAIPTICAWLADMFLPAFAREYPGISIPMEESEYLCFIENMRQGKAKIGLTGTLDAYEETEEQLFALNGFSAIPLLEDEYVVIMGRNHPLAQKEILSPADLNDVKICTYTSSWRHPKSPITQIFKSLGYNADASICLNSRETITRVLYEGKHVTMLLEKMMRKSWPVREGLLTMRRVEGLRLAPSRHWLLHLDKSLLTEPEKLVVDWLCANYGREDL